MINYSNLTYHVERMTPEDIEAVMEIEFKSFSAPWSARAYDYELHYNEMARYYVVRPQAQLQPRAATRSGLWDRLLGNKQTKISNHDSVAPIVGYGGVWLMVDDAHISTIATHPDWRRRGIGELLLVAMIDGALEVDARAVTLEVRVSNEGAQVLYRKYGFDVAGVRKRYYSDNNEDAWIMSTPIITTAEYQRKFQQLKQTLFTRLSH